MKLFNFHKNFIKHQLQRWTPIGHHPSQQLRGFTRPDPASPRRDRAKRLHVPPPGGQDQGGRAIPGGLVLEAKSPQFCAENAKHRWQTNEVRDVPGLGG